MYCCKCKDYVETDELKYDGGATYRCRRCKTTICVDEWGELDGPFEEISPTLTKGCRYIAIQTPEEYVGETYSYPRGDGKTQSREIVGYEKTKKYVVAPVCDT